MHVMLKPIFDESDLEIALSPRGRVTFRTTGPYEGAALSPERATAAALEILAVTAPEVLAALEAEVADRRLRLVQGGDEGGAA